MNNRNRYRIDWSEIRNDLVFFGAALSILGIIVCASLAIHATYRQAWPVTQEATR